MDYPVQAVYRAVGYLGSELPEVDFDARRGVIPNDGGRVLDADGTHVPGLYATGWIKRGPVGLIGHTKGDALETIGCLLEDRLTLPDAERPARSKLWSCWNPAAWNTPPGRGGTSLTPMRSSSAKADVPEPGTDVVRERIKVVDREQMVNISKK